MLTLNEKKILSYLQGKMSAEELSRKSGIPLSSILSLSQSLKEKGYVEIEQAEEVAVEASPEGLAYARQGLPEQAVHAAAKRQAPLSSLSKVELSVGLAWATKNGWVKVEGGKLKSLCEAGDYPLHAALRSIAEGKGAGEKEISILEKRKLVSKAKIKRIYLSPTSLLKEGKEAAEESISSLTRELLLSGGWKGKSFKPYDISAKTEKTYPAKAHPISRLKERIGKIFAEMGFEEMEGPELQSAFWNFDALFQPQDHPARELADTFYVKGKMSMPGDLGLIERVKEVHEKFWGGQWSRSVAQKPVLRTHTTAVSASYLYHKCRGAEPKKYFCIGKVYRNEATDYKHLAEFFQVEGIVVWEGATFCDLLGLLKEFYCKLGFEKIRFQPSYFPYTEPSLEVSVYFEKKRQWLELGGAGIFRPEVSIPLCNRYPVLAWGLSLERPLMLLSDMEDIRDFYKGDVGWLREQKLR